MDGAVPKASVVVPCWNVERWVEDAVGSVLRGTFQDFEIIAVDDGSTDGTGEVLDRLASADARVRVLHQPNRGVSSARNRGLDAARGKYLFFLDGDDSYEPDFLALGVAELERTDSDYCVFAFAERRNGAVESHVVPLNGDYRYADNAAIRAHFLKRLIGYSMDEVRAWYAGRSLVAEREIGSVWRCAFRREVIERIGLRFDESLVNWEDAYFTYEFLLSARRMTCVNRPIYIYRIHAGSAVESRRRSAHAFANKLAFLRRRQDINRRTGGTIGGAYAASCVFSLLEMFAFLRTVPIGWTEGRRIVLEYAADPEVRAALRAFPLSWRKPVLALAVLALRVLGAGFIYAVCWTLFAPFRRLNGSERQKSSGTATASR